MSNYPDDIHSYDHDPRSPLYEDRDEAARNAAHDEAVEDCQPLVELMRDLEALADRARVLNVPDLVESIGAAIHDDLIQGVLWAACEAAGNNHDVDPPQIDDVVKTCIEQLNRNAILKGVSPCCIVPRPNI